MYTEKQRKEIVEKYTKEMEIIKLRTNQINKMGGLLGYKEPTVEYKALQIRKIIEQILLASLIANAKEYKEMYNRLGKEWNARLISRDLERINPDFFPKAVIDDHEKHIITNAEISLSCEETIDIYEKVNRYLHAANPYAMVPDYDKVNQYLDKCIGKIIRLLNTHTITLLGQEVFLFVIMKTTNTGNVAVQWFEKCNGEGSSS